ncbi:MAG: SAM-dependent methyltransferase [Actinobacteria bacterium]|nr:SAM-dependent methyltransferase [Actinomycetota bacterium]
MNKNNEKIPSSFRDPSGFLFLEDGILFRQINNIYRNDFDYLINSGLFKTLREKNLIIPHEDVPIKNFESDNCYKIIKPKKINFISYPYEWCFSQLKDAALATLKLQKIALEFKMALKDASAYNIQFHRGQPIFIDTLSFEKYKEGEPWTAYRQFCRHFLGPLALMAYKDIRLGQLSRIFMDGPPLDLVSSLLPNSTRFKFSLLTHLHLHGLAQKHFAAKTVKKTGRKMSKHSLLALIDNLESAVKKIKWQAAGTEWGEYYSFTNYSDEAFQDKEQSVADFIGKINPKEIWDFGANTGVFSRLAADKGIKTISFDIDPAAVEKNYKETIKKQEKNILPLFLDLTNPSPAIGWENKERISLMERGPTDAAMALALIHHLAISNNLPLDYIAGFFRNICRSLIIEFVPKSDSQVQKLLSTRADIFPEYNRQNFEKEFSKFFTIQHSTNIKNSGRILYLMKRKP